MKYCIHQNHWTSSKKGSTLEYAIKALLSFKWGACGGAVVEALRYKPEGHGMDSLWCHWNISLT
jgi:hypothetical protein